MKRFALFAFCTLVTAPALAQDAPIDNRARAQQLFESALTDAEHGDFAHACPKFLASQAADPKASTLQNLANCYEKNGQTASAWGAYREAENLARKTNHPDWADNAKQHAAALEPKLVHLEIVVSSTANVPNIVVSRDGTKLQQGEWGVPIPVDPGEHVIAASADGYIAIEKKLDVKDGDAKFDVPLLEKLPPPEPEPVPAPFVPPKGFPTGEKPLPKSRWSTMEVVGLASAGVGALGLAGGGLMAIVAASNYDAAAAHCTNGTHGCDPNSVTTADKAYDLAGWATATFITGAVLAAAGVALILFSPDEKKLDRSASRAPNVLAW